MTDNVDILPGVKFEDALCCIKIILNTDGIYTNLMNIMKDWSDKENFKRWYLYKDIRVYIFLLKNALIKKDEDAYWKVLIEMCQKYEKDPFIVILTVGAKYVDTYSSLSLMEEKVEKGIVSEQTYLDMCNYMKICHSVVEMVSSTL
jgi:hypothetical protein